MVHAYAISSSCNEDPVIRLPVSTGDSVESKEIRNLPIKAPAAVLSMVSNNILLVGQLPNLPIKIIVRRAMRRALLERN